MTFLCAYHKLVGISTISSHQSQTCLLPDQALFLQKDNFYTEGLMPNGDPKLTLSSECRSTQTQKAQK